MQKMCVNEKSYDIIKLLGHGKGGYSYLVTDGTKEYVLKQIHHEPCDYYQFGNKIESEINDYERLKKIGIRMPELLEVDIKNERILKEYIKGDTIYDYVLRNEMKQHFVDQMKEMCVCLYAANTNIDYFPTNFVVQDDKLYYIDYECNDYMEEWNFENWGIKYWSQTKEFITYVKENTKMTDKDIVYKFFKEGYENKNYDFVMEYVSEDYIDHSPAGARGNAAAVNILKIVAEQFSDLKIEVLDLFAENGMVATRILYNGIHSGTCMGIPATGKPITFEALENFKVVDGRIVESWGYWPDKEIEQKLS